MKEYIYFMLATEYKPPSTIKKETENNDNIKMRIVETDDVFEKDVETLRQSYGLEKNSTIELTLKQALELMPRKRKRSDAYKKLQKHLQSEYGVILKFKKNNKL
jgi:hypothetical protein